MFTTSACIVFFKNLAVILTFILYMLCLFSLVAFFSQEHVHFIEHNCRKVCEGKGLIQDQLGAGQGMEAGVRGRQVMGRAPGRDDSSGSTDRLAESVLG